MNDLVQKHCVPCEGGAMPLSREDSAKLMPQVPEWQIATNGLSISREFTFKDFVEAMDFANKISVVAEAEGHHPDLAIGWGKVGVTLMTHAIGGLSENDFIVASKIDAIR